MECFPFIQAREGQLKSGVSYVNRGQQQQQHLTDGLERPESEEQRKTAQQLPLNYNNAHANNTQSTPMVSGEKENVDQLDNHKYLTLKYIHNFTCTSSQTHTHTHTHAHTHTRTHAHTHTHTHTLSNPSVLII